MMLDTQIVDTRAKSVNKVYHFGESSIILTIGRRKIKSLISCTPIFLECGWESGGEEEGLVSSVVRLVNLLIYLISQYLERMV